MVLGRLDESLEQLHRARELDPLSPTILTNNSATHLYKRQHDEAITYAKLALEINPGFPWALDALGGAYMYKSMPEQAAETFRKIGSLGDKHTFGAGRLALLSASAGMSDQARDFLREFERGKREGYRGHSLVNAALIYAALGEKKRAFELLYGAVDGGELLLQDLRYSPDFDPLRSDPEFEDLMRRLESRLGATRPRGQ